MREAAKRNKVLLCGRRQRDASANSLEKIVPLLNARRVRFIRSTVGCGAWRRGGQRSDRGRGHRRPAVGCCERSVTLAVDPTVRRMFEQAFSQ